MNKRITCKIFRARYLNTSNIDRDEDHKKVSDTLNMHRMSKNLTHLKSFKN